MTDDPAMTCTPHPPPTADGSPRPFDPAWRTETVRALATGIEAEGAFDRLPILADALEEAGCDDELLLRHCRGCEWHEAGCWALRQVLAHFSSGYQPTPGLPVPRVVRERAGAVSPEEVAIHRFVIWVFIVLTPLIALASFAERIGGNKAFNTPAVLTPKTGTSSDQLTETVRSNLRHLLQLRNEWAELGKLHAEDSPEYQAKGQEYWDAIDGMRVTAGMCGVTFPERPKVLSHRTAPIIVVPDMPRR